MKRTLNTRFAAILTLTATLICALIAGVTVFSFSSGVARAASDYAASWANYIDTSRNNGGKQVTFTLNNGGWTAESGGFGSGTGFTDRGGLMVPSGADIVLDLNGNELNGNNAVGSVITVYGTLTVVNEVGTGKITGGSAENGGGVLVSYIDNEYVSGKGKFILNGGEISGNTATNGGGVFVDSDGEALKGSFIMNGGTVGNNTATNGGGVKTNSTATFEMTGGTIGNNTANGNGGGVYVDSYGCNASYRNGGEFKMRGGTITGNKAGDGAGVYVSLFSSFTMDDGVISNNTASSNGGGVYLRNGDISEGDISKFKYPEHDTNFYIDFIGGSFTMNGGSVSENGANNGGGVYVAGNNERGCSYSYIYNEKVLNIKAIFCGATFRMNGGTVSLNSASYNGGGVAVGVSAGERQDPNAARFDMSGGVISENSASNGGGVSVESEFSVSSTATVKGNYLKSDKAVNNNVWLNPARGCKITVNGELKDGARIGVTDSVNEFTSGYSDSNAKEPWNYFFSDSGKVIGINGGNAYIKTLTVLAAPGFSNGYSFEYTGARQYVTTNLSEDDQGKVAVEGLVSGVNVGEYTVTFKIIDEYKNDFAWEDGTDSTTVTWRIERKKTSLPTLSKTGVNFSDGANTFVISAVDDLDITLPGGWARSGNTVTVPGGTKAGVYNIVIAPDTNHCWVDGSTDAVTLTFEVLDGGAAVGPVVDDDDGEVVSFIDWYIIGILILVVVFIVAMIINIIRIRKCDRENAEILAEKDKL